jgi:hypothetical protein
VALQGRLEPQTVDEIRADVITTPERITTHSLKTIALQVRVRIRAHY